MLNRKKTSGFIGVVFLAIALIGIVIAAIASMSRESSSGTAREKMKMDSAVILKQGVDFKLAMDKAALAGADPYAQAMHMSGRLLILGYPDDINREISFKPPTTAIPASAVGTNQGAYNYDTYSYGIDGANSSERYYTFLSLGLKSKEYCQMINNMIQGAALTIEPRNNMDPEHGPEGCYNQGGGVFIYYKYILENIPYAPPDNW